MFAIRKNGQNEKRKKKKYIMKYFAILNTNAMQPHKAENFTLNIGQKQAFYAHFFYVAYKERKKKHTLILFPHTSMDTC
jgi:hypothetical protein